MLFPTPCFPPLIDPDEYTCAVSLHPDPAACLGEVLGEVTERVGPAPGLAIVLTSGPATDHMDEIVDAIHSLLCPIVLLSSPTSQIFAGFERPSSRSNNRNGILVWAGNPGDVEPVRYDLSIPAKPQAQSHPDSTFLIGFGSGESSELSRLLLGENLNWVIGLNQTPLETGKLWLDNQSYQSGIVGCRIQAAPRVVLSHGYVAVGDPMTVTGLHNDRIVTLAGQRAKSRMDEVIAQLTPTERRAAGVELCLGVLVDQMHERYQANDFVLRTLQGSTQAGELVLEPLRPGGAALPTETPVGEVNVGSVVQFHVPYRGNIEAAQPSRNLASGEAGLVISAGTNRISDLEFLSEFGMTTVAGAVCDRVLGQQHGHPVDLAAGAAVMVFG